MRKFGREKIRKVWRRLAQKMEEELGYGATWAYGFDICIYVYIDIFCAIIVSRKGGNLRR